MTIAVAHDFALPITSESTLRDFVELAWGVRVPDVKVCPHHTTPWRAFCDAYFCAYPVSVWLGSRGFAGKSFTLALLSMTEAVTLSADVTVLGGSGEQSKRVSEHAQNLWHYESAPRGMLLSDAATTTKLSNGAKVQALMASQASVRGPHPQRLRLDEIDEMALPILDAAMGQPMSKKDIKAQTVMSSTRQYSDGTMQEILQRAQQRGWGVYEWCVSGESDIMYPGGQKKMKNIRPGDTIYAYKKNNIIETTVTDWWKVGRKRTIVVRIAGRGSFRCTPEHRVLSDQGWKTAETLAAGDRVFCVPQATKTSREVGEKFRGYLLGLYKKIYGHSKFRDSVPVVQKRKNKTSEDLHRLLQIKNVLPKHADGGSNGPGEGEGVSVRDESKKNEQVRVRRGGLTEKHEYFVRVSGLVRKICGRFSFNKLRFSSRGEWKILAWQQKTTRARPGESKGSSKNGDESTGTLGRRTSFVEFAIVESVESGRDEFVYDLTVECGESFICNGIVVHNCYRETLEPHGWLKQSDVDQKRNEVTDAMWNTEYDNQEPNPSSRAIQPEAVEKMFDRSLGEFEGAPHEYIEIEPPIPGATYAHGADWARKSDWTIIDTFRTDVAPAKCVAFERTGRLDWPVMIGKLDARIARYGGRSHDDGTGLGDVIKSYKIQPSVSVIMIGAARAKMLSDYVVMCEKGSIIYPFIRWVYQEHKFASVEAVFGSAEHLPDTIAAGALAGMGISKPGGWVLTAR